jgi:hypothetical protein
MGQVVSNFGSPYHFFIQTQGAAGIFYFLFLNT